MYPFPLWDCRVTYLTKYRESSSQPCQSEGFKDSRNWNPECSFLQGPISVTFQSDDIFDAHEFFLKNGLAFFIPLFSILSFFLIYFYVSDLDLWYSLPLCGFLLISHHLTWFCAHFLLCFPVFLLDLTPGVILLTSGQGPYYIYSILYVPTTLGLFSFLYTVFLVYYMLAKEILFSHLYFKICYIFLSFLKPVISKIS